MAMTKKELITIIENLSKERDEFFDEVVNLKDEITEKETFEVDSNTLIDVKNILYDLKEATDRISLGIPTAKDDFDRSFDKLMSHID